jgi:hypothetical protein
MGFNSAFKGLNINRIPYNPAQVFLPFSRYMTDCGKLCHC